MQLVNLHTSVLVVLLIAICVGGSSANLGFVHSFDHTEPWYLPSSSRRDEYDFEDWILLCATGCRLDHP